MLSQDPLLPLELPQELILPAACQFPEISLFLSSVVCAYCSNLRKKVKRDFEDFEKILHFLPLGNSSTEGRKLRLP